MAYTFTDLIDEVLETIKEPLSEKEIWDKAVELQLDIKVGTAGKTPWKSIGARLYDMLKFEDTKYVKVGTRPRRFQLKKYVQNVDDPKLLEAIDKKVIAQEKQLKKFNERDLHPLLVRYVNSDQHFNAHCKTIYHESSKTRKKGYNKWLHPDIVGVYFPFNDFNKPTINAQKAFATSSVKLFSFELKINLTFGNLREYYFQAVSNSSWANEGYLVCLHIQDDSDLINELQRLNSAFGIGVIRLNTDDIVQSEIVFPSTTKSDLDWLTIDRLVTENTDFKQFMIDIEEDSNIGKLKSEYDEIKSDDDILKILSRVMM